jgi:hypothetical protein
MENAIRSILMVGNNAVVIPKLVKYVCTSSPSNFEARVKIFLILNSFSR